MLEGSRRLKNISATLLSIYVSVADDYATLAVGEFLNDIIIDFYLRQGSKYYDSCYRSEYLIFALLISPFFNDFNAAIVDDSFLCKISEKILKKIFFGDHGQSILFPLLFFPLLVLRG